MRNRNLHILALILLLCGVAAVTLAGDSGPGPEERFAQALSDFKAGSYELSSAGARETARLFPGTVWEGRSLFLAGRADAARGELELAADELGRSRTLYPALADYADFIMANAYRDAGKLDDAASLYMAVADRSPNGVLAADCLINAGRALNGVGRYEEAVKPLERLVEKKAGRSYTSEALYLLAEDYEASGNIDAVYMEYRRLWLDYPESGFTGKTGVLARGLATDKKPLPEPDAADHMARARKLVDLGLFKRAVSEYGDAYRLMPESDPGRGDAMLGLGYASYRAKDNQTAESWLSAVADSGKYPGLVPEALYWLSRTYLRTGQEDDFVASANKCGLEHSGSARAADCLFVLGAEQIYNGNYNDAIEALTGVTEGHPDSDVYPDALWRLGWAWFMCGEYGVAEGVFRELYEGYPETEYAARGKYWRARALELMGDTAESGILYGELAADYGNSYYGIIVGSHGGPILARQRPENIGEPPALPKSRPGTDEAMVRADELGLQGMTDYGIRELNADAYRYSRDPDSLLNLASAYDELGEYKRPLELAERLYRTRMKTGLIPIPRDMMHVIFPAGYWDIIMRESDTYGVDPFLVAALVREESHFDPKAQSGAGAMGLMQLMPKTAAVVCRRLGRPEPSGESLKQGEYNLPLGICHLGYLLEKHKGRLAYVLAEYNAGPVAVGRWMARMPDAPDDVFIENIGYPETRNYVRRVIRNYGIYRRLYGPG